MWKIGQKVVCLHNFRGISIDGSVKKDPPRADEIYTINSIRVSGGATYLTLEETFLGEGGKIHDYWDKKFMPLSDWEKAGEAVDTLVKNIESLI